MLSFYRLICMSSRFLLEMPINGYKCGKQGNSRLGAFQPAAAATATETELRNYARGHLAHFKCPQRIQFVSELPKTATGKVQKYVLRGKPAISKQ